MPKSRNPRADALDLDQLYVPLLPCVADLEQAVDRLHEACTQPFPQFAVDVPSLQESTRDLRTAKAWADRVHSTYGTPHPVKGFEKSVLSCFWEPPLREIISLRPTGGHVPLKRVSRVVDTFQGRPTELLEPDWGNLKFTMVRKPRRSESMRMDRASSVLGALPERFESSCVPILLMRCERRRGEFIREPEIPHTEAGWQELIGLLRSAYVAVLSKSLGLVRWVKEGVAELRSPLLPEVRYVRAASNNSHIVEVEVACVSRERRITGLQCDLLIGLKKHGHMTCARNLKMDLLNRLPELHAWIRAGARELGADVANEGTYAVHDALRDRLFDDGCPSI